MFVIRKKRRLPPLSMSILRRNFVPTGNLNAQPLFTTPKYRPTVLQPMAEADPRLLL
jgi:hypothetical protein